MLDERIITLARKAAAVQLKDRDEPLAISAGGIKAKLQGNGRMYIYLMKRYAEEVAGRADVIWRSLHRAHTTVGAPLSDKLRSDFLAAFRADLDAQISHLSPTFVKDMEGAPQSTKERSWNAKLGDARDHELQRYESEIDLYITALETARAKGTQPPATYIVHGHVGAFVTGAGASASVVQNIGLDQREALVKALELVKQTISAAPDLVNRDKHELVELADEATTEVAKDQPNGKRLGAVLRDLASTVQGIASGPGAYEALRSAAAAIGFPV